jgi:hypothetical protein
MENTTAAPEAAPEKKSPFEIVITSTPILLTVIATFILGQSSSEMTKAQYQRSVAGQNQSKVGDQWAFFQAKRIRGTTYEATAIALLAQKADPFTADTLLEAAAALLREIQLTDKELPAGADKAREKLKALRKKAEAAEEQIKAALSPGKDGWKGKRSTLTSANVKVALDALETYPDPEAPPKTDDKIDAEQRKLLDEILDDIRRFKPEKDIAPKTLALKTDTLDTAMERAKAKAAQVAEHGKGIDRVLEEIDALVNQQAALGRELQRVLNGYLAKASDGQKESQNLERHLDRVRSQSARLLGDYKAARYTFDARRYEDDARSNQDAAYLYDVQVLQSSALSDRHLKRSFGFMIAMLVAQIGVTIGSVALALKWKVPVWLVAAFAGLAAIVLGAYVFLELGPFLW